MDVYFLTYRVTENCA